MMRHILLASAAVSTLWSLAIWLVGGFTLALGGIELASRDPFRPLLVAILAAVAYLVVSGPARVREDVARFGRFPTPLVILLALCPAAAGLAMNGWTAAGADSFAYVSQADLWVQGSLTVPAPIADAVPWPDPVWSFSPNGFRPAESESALVPVTAPGLPLMMAAAKVVAGHCAMFWIVPITGAVLVWMTFALGRRLRSSALGLAAAWLVATSPVFLAMLTSPMSDVPAAAFWAVATYYALGGSKGEAIASGLAASAAILIRPNLAPLAVVLVTWKLLGAGLRTSARQAILLVLGILPGCLLVAWLNDRLYGSPLVSGYGNLTGLFSLANVATNLRQYGGWLIESHTPLVLVGIGALIVPMRIIWSTPETQRRARLLGSVTATVWALYLAYAPFDAWWYLRFLLPSWPAICIGTAAVCLGPTGRSPGLPRAIATAILIAVGLHGVWFASRRGAFPSGEGDHRYVSIAALVEQSTEPSSVIITGQHTGPTRYYAGRITVRFDLLDEAWLDRAVQWLSEHGRRPYFLLEEWEIPRFQKRYAGKNRLGALALAPVFAYRAPGVPGNVYLFDPARPDGPTLRPAPPDSVRRKCVEPAAPVMLRLR